MEEDCNVTDAAMETQSLRKPRKEKVREKSLMYGVEDVPSPQMTFFIGLQVGYNFYPGGVTQFENVRMCLSRI